MKVLITAPPMLLAMDAYRSAFAQRGVQTVEPSMVQVLAEDELVDIVPGVEGWIAGDCPVSRRVLAAGVAGRLRAVVKWGVGVDNVDFQAADDLGIRVANTPAMFGEEVADVALAYVTGLARETYLIDRGVRAGGWPKPRGLSLGACRAALVGYGDVGKAIAPRLRACRMSIFVYDPQAADVADGCELRVWPDGLQEVDFVVLACALTPSSRHLLDASAIARCKPGVRIVNISRGALIDERALIAALASGQVHSAALDVFEREPLPQDSPLRGHDRCILGSHNASNTVHAVERASRRAIDILFDLFTASGLCVSAVR